MRGSMIRGMPLSSAQREALLIPSVWQRTLYEVSHVITHKVICQKLQCVTSLTLGVLHLPVLCMVFPGASHHIVCLLAWS